MLPLSATAAQAATSAVPARMTPSTPKRRISRPGHQPGRVHADDVPLDDERGVGVRVRAEAHRQRRRGHQQVHQAVAQRRGEHRHDEHRLPHDRRERAAAAGALGGRRRRHVQPRLHRDRHQRDRRQHQERAQERRAERILGPARGFRPEEAAGDAAGEHQRNRHRAVGRRGDLGGGEPVLQAEGVVDADQRRRHAVQREAAEPQRHRREAGADDVDRGARHEAAAAADAAHPQRGRHRRQRGTQHVGRRTQRRERPVGRERVADEAVHRDQARRVDEQQRLAAGQQEEVAAGGLHVRGNAGGGLQ